MTPKMLLRIVAVLCLMGYTSSARAEIDCSKLKPTKIQKGEWSAPDHTLRSERVDIYWGDKRSAEPWKDFPKDDPRYFDPREIMKTAEEYWTQVVEKLQVYRGKNYVPRDRLRIVIRSTWKKWRGKPTDGKHYELTPRVLEIGYAYLASLQLNEIAQAYIERLQSELPPTMKVEMFMQQLQLEQL